MRFQQFLALLKETFSAWQEDKAPRQTVLRDAKVGDKGTLRLHYRPGAKIDPRHADGARVELSSPLNNLNQWEARLLEDTACSKTGDVLWLAADPKHPEVPVAEFIPDEKTE